MKSLEELLPDPQQVLALEPEELAGVVLEVFNSNPRLDLSISRHNFGNYEMVRGYPQPHREQLQMALMEAWAWLEREGLLVPVPAQEGWYFVSRRGRKIAQASDLAAHRRSDTLPRQHLHPVIAQKVWATFLRGDYDTAVFQAFKEVEVTVRLAGGFSANDIGTSLMRKAFDASNGPLSNASALAAERQAMSDLFAGAIGSYKNPHSHRNVQIDADDAVEMISLASHLLKIVEARSATKSP